MESRTLLGTLVLVGLLLVPTAASQEEPPAGLAIPLKYFLNAEGENLTLTNLAPSAANATTWTVELDGDQWYGPSTVALDLPVPAPRFLVNESQGVEGAITGSYECETSTLSFCGGVTIRVYLVEGERQVTLLDRGLSTSERTFQFAGDFPGHGGDEGPHTHGDGSSADRGLFTDDFVFRVVLSAEDDTLSNYAFGHQTYTVDLQIDGVSFAHVWALAPAPAAPDAASANQTAPPQPGNTTEPPGPGNNTTGGNATNSSQGSGLGGGAYSLDTDSMAQAPGPGGLGFLAAVAAAGWAFARRGRPGA
jgi:hypothetical protein